MVLQLAKAVLAQPTAPHFEDGVSAVIESHLKGIGARIKKDAHGNLVASVGHRPRIAFCAHMDHPGFRIKLARGKALDAEFLGWVPREFFRKGARVALFTEDGERAGTARIDGTSGKWPKNKRVRLRLLNGSGDHARFGMWDLPAFKMRGGRIHTRACDDLIGCTAILATLRELARRKKPAMGIFTRREELGLCGAFELAKAGKLPKRIPIVSIETSKELCNALQGDGPIVRVGDRASIFNPGVTANLCGAAGRLRRFRWQRRLMDGGTCEATAFNRHGYRAGGLCIALGNYHNCGGGRRIAAEYVHIGDLKGLVRLMIEAASTDRDG